MSTATYTPSVGTVTMFSTTWCGYCRVLKRNLDRVGQSYTEINIEEHDDAAEIVMKVNGGNQVVPTVLFSDGSALTNPSVDAVTDRIAALGN